MLYIRQRNYYCLIPPIPGLGYKEVCLMFQTEVCELVIIYMLNLLSKEYNKSGFRLYRDDGLTVLKKKSGPQSELVKENIQKISEKHRLDIIIKFNMKTVII